jgi:hypothetical protein
MLRKDTLRKDASDLLYLLGFKEAEMHPLFGITLRNVITGLLNATNQAELPQALYGLAARRAAGEFLRLMLTTGQLPEAALSLSPEAMETAVKQIKQGEETITFAVAESKSPEEQARARLAELADWLLKPEDDQIAAFRRIVW